MTRISLNIPKRKEEDLTNLLDNDYINVTGDTMTGPLTVLRVNPGEVSTKPDDIEFFDTWIGSGSEDGAKIIVHNKVEARTGEIYIDQYGRFHLNSPNDNLILTASEGVLIESLTFSGADISSTAAIMTLEPNKDDTAIGRLAVQLTQNKQIYFQYDEDGVSENIIEFSDLPIRTTGSLKIGGEEDVVQEIVQANSTQTANLAEFQNSSGSALTVVDKNGRIGIGTSITGNERLYIGGQENGGGATTAFRNQLTIASGDSTGFFGQQNNLIFSSPGTLSASGMIGLYNKINNTGSGNITKAAAEQIWIKNWSTGVITDAYGINISSTTNLSTGSIVNNYGIYIEDQSAATTLNYAIYTNDGINSFGDPITLRDVNGLLGTPVAGTIEFDNDRFYITNVGTQRAIDRTNDVITSTTTVANTTTETTIYTGTLGADDLKAGNVIKLYVSGTITNDSAADDITIRKYIGNTLVETFNPAIGNVSGADWHMNNIMTVRSVGATGSVALHGKVEIHGETSVEEDTYDSIETVDTTVSEDITITVQWDNAKAGNTISIYQGMMEFKN